METTRMNGCQGGSDELAGTEVRTVTDASVSAAGMRIVRLLVGNPPQTVSDLIRATGVTRTAITEQLNELIAGGFVDRNVERLPGRGRPRHLYSATNAALLLLFASNEHLVVPAIWRAVEDLGGEALMQRVVGRVSEILADHYRRKITATEPADRLREMVEILRQEGGVVEVEGDDEQLVMHKRSCAFISMFDSKRNVCQVDESLLTAVVGAPVRRVACRHDGANCCSFELASPIQLM